MASIKAVLLMLSPASRWIIGAAFFYFFICMVIIAGMAVDNLDTWSLWMVFQAIGERMNDLWGVSFKGLKPAPIYTPIC